MMMNFDKQIKKALGKTKKKSNPFSMKPFKLKPILPKSKDWDFDGVPNWKDCQPRNTMRQDFDLTKKTGYAIFDYPSSAGRKRVIRYENPKRVVEERARNRGLSVDKFISKIKNSRGGDQSTTPFNKFKELVSSPKEILPPAVREISKGRADFFEGEHRLVAAYETNTPIPIITVTDMTEEEKEAYKKIPREEQKKQESNELYISNVLPDNYYDDEDEELAELLQYEPEDDDDDDDDDTPLTPNEQREVDEMLLEEEILDKYKDDVEL